ncbi:hypothetical protein [Streptomyces yaizuensis]|uniref:Membrane protein n=1 Tax=Streptomyces yaizuensis TaxID=2989713 RepID=A0ABQ5P0K6_9ACTN|nr:hypothetical protein [Streptomyces sp. YSPA8]GLF96039.1 membrane protein [Streptomyces sp. YSPA8]
MTKFFLSLHVLAAIIAVGPVTVAASMFPPALRQALAAPGPPGAPGPLVTLRTLHRICRVYAAVGIAVPVFGFATASSLGVLGSAWLITSIVLTAGAAAILLLLLLPGQEQALAAAQDGETPGPAASAARLALLTGVFNLLWTVVTVLMIVRPGSTTGA